MPIPDFQTVMLPLLKFAADGKEHSLRDAIDFLAEQYKLIEQERRELLASGQQFTFDNRVGWARTYLTKACLFEATKRAHFRISERGLAVLKENPAEINVKYLKIFPELINFLKPKDKIIEDPKKREEVDETPEESLENAYQYLRQNLANEIVSQLKEVSPSRFEKIVVELIVKMGYGGSLKDAGQAIGRSGDGGIDGVINEDRLGLDIIYIQAKRWENIVGRPEIQKFAGALQGQRARKGIFLTTSNFSKEARDYTANIDNKIILIDGEELAQYMIEYNIGVTPVSTYELKRIDSDYFVEE